MIFRFGSKPGWRKTRKPDPRINQLGVWLAGALKVEPGWDELGADIRLNQPAADGPAKVFARLWSRFGASVFDYEGSFTSGCEEEKLILELAGEGSWTAARLVVSADWKKGKSEISLTPTSKDICEA